MRTLKVEKKGKVLNHKVVNTLWKIAQSVDYNRSFLKVIYFDSANNKLISTNGKSLLVVDISSINENYNLLSNNDGYFHYLKDTLVEVEYNSKYPDYKRVIAADDTECKHFNFPTFEKHHYSDKEKQLARALEMACNGQVTNVKEQAILNIDFNEYYYDYPKLESYIKLKNEYCTGLMMLPRREIA